MTGKDNAHSWGGEATDCHIHIVGEPDRFPFAARRSYTVPPASVADYRKALAGTGAGRAVVVQPSIYGTDNSALLASLEEFRGAARGVVVIDPEASTESDLADLDSKGVRGVRLNILSVKPEGDPLAPLARLGALLKGSRWHIQLFVGPDQLAALVARQRSIPVPLVIDHFGMIRPGAADCFLPDLAALVKSGASVKLSAPYRIADDALDPAVVDLAGRIFAFDPDRMLWGSDWPHPPKHDDHTTAATVVSPYQTIDTAGNFRAVETWFPDLADRRRLLVDNPARLYGW